MRKQYIISLFSFFAAIFSVSIFLSVSNAEEIRFTRQGSVYHIPATINGEMRLNFMIDSGAGVVYIPRHIFNKLRASGAIRNSDIIREGFSRIANGQLVETLFFNIRELKIGKTVLHNVAGGVGSDSSPLLLGQSALKKLEPWHIQTKRGVFQFGKPTKINKSYVSSGQKINRGEVLGFINYYISLHNNGIPDRTAILYAPRIDYLDHGLINRRQLVRRKEAFMDRWQQIRFSLLQLKTVNDIPGKPDQKKVVFSLSYQLSSDIEQKKERGQVDITLVLKKSDGTIYIISQKEKVRSRYSY